jgi:hypothetical protein
VPNTSFLEAGEHLVDSTWDVIAGSVRPKGRVLVYDDHGGDQAMSTVEKLAGEGLTVELVTPDRVAGHDVTGTLYPAYLAAFYEHGVSFTPDLRLLRVERRDGGLVGTFFNEFTGREIEKVADHVIVEHGTLPLDDLYWSLKEGSSNHGEVDIDALIAGQPQQLVNNPAGNYQLFRVGDAVSSRNIHAAIYDSLRLCMVM